MKKYLGLAVVVTALVGIIYVVVNKGEDTTTEDTSSEDTNTEDSSEE